MYIWLLLVGVIDPLIEDIAVKNRSLEEKRQNLHLV